MSDDRDGIFATQDPIALVGAWMNEAELLEPNDANAMALATVDAAGCPNVRIVLLKEIEPDAFVFYTNYQSTKAEELRGAGQAAFVLHWKSLRRQVRVRGHIEVEDGPKADAYYASRSVNSRIGAWASEQSRPLSTRGHLEERAQDMAKKYGDNPPRPPYWGGFRLRPFEIEFWADGAHRLHDRFQWMRPKIDVEWTVQRLNP